MTLASTTVIDKTEVLEDGTIQVRQAEIITRDGVEITRTFHRWVLTPGEDITTQDPKVQAICNAVWTPEVVAAYQAAQAAQLQPGT
jgi:hypothetical protein